LNFSERIINWYRENKRELPWRDTKDPYKIWLSEIILQQTQVKQGLPYYHKFVEAFPTVEKLAAASEEEVLKLWQGLGYYSRARNLHHTAKFICNDLDGEFPDNYNNIIKLKGVGEYTASAISSFAYEEPKAVLDGNVFRVLSRYFGIDTPVNSTEGIKQFKTLVYQVFNENKPSEHNQAIMEFGALLCKPKSPDCMFCPLQENCVAYQSGNVNNLPVKLKKLKRRKRFFNYLIIINAAGEFILKQRLRKDIWQKLYEFPLLEADSELKSLSQKDLDSISILKGNGAVSAKKLTKKPLKHVLSHQDIMASFWKIETDISRQKLLDEGFILTREDELSKYAMPVLISKFIEETFF